MTTVDDASRPSRIAGPDEGISAEELQLAARNHGIPLEALRYDVTRPGCTTCSSTTTSRTSTRRRTR